MLFGRGQQIAICAVAGTIMCVFVIFWYLPLRKKMGTIKQAKAEQVLTIARGMADAGQLPVLKEQLQEMRIELQGYEAKIPDQRDFGSFLGRITDLMNEHNLKEQNIEPGDIVEADKFNCIPVSMQCRGRLTQIFNFYEHLQDLDRLIRIEQIKLSNDAAYNGQVSMETKAVIYYKAGMEQG
ncbi:type 4a pilus biogenesis protein PilO [Planctomycetota bacterium]